MRIPVESSILKAYMYDDTMQNFTVTKNMNSCGINARDSCQNANIIRNISRELHGATWEERRDVSRQLMEERFDTLRLNTLHIEDLYELGNELSTYISNFIDGCFKGTGISNRRFGQHEGFEKLQRDKLTAFAVWANGKNVILQLLESCLLTDEELVRARF